jgi:hypothetical protein
MTPPTCATCHATISGATFIEDGQPYHFGCRPSQTSDRETFFGDEDGETYWGFGHLSKPEFAAQVDAANEEFQAGEYDPVPAERVQHLWAVWTDEEPHETWRVVPLTTHGSFAVTRCAYDGHQVVVQSNKPHPMTRRDKRIAELEAALAKARVGELEAMNVLEGTELKLKQAEAALSFAAQRIVGGPPDAVDECLADLRARAAEEDR